MLSGRFLRNHQMQVKVKFRVPCPSCPIKRPLKIEKPQWKNGCAATRKCLQACEQEVTADPACAVLPCA